MKMKILILILLTLNQVFAENNCPKLLQLAVAKILHSQNNQLHQSPEVMRIASRFKLKNPADKIDRWLSFLDNVAKKADENPRIILTIKKALIKKHVIETKDVPEEYFQSQIAAARTLGYGNIEMTEARKREMANIIVAEQKASLEYWIDYFISSDSKMYPTWLKYWMFEGMTKLSTYDLEFGRFAIRDKYTWGPFPELNYEAISQLADEVMIKSPTIENLNFGKLYGKKLQALGIKKDRNFYTNKGQWVHYQKGSDYLPLVRSIRGRNTGWCTAGESTAESQLAGGDFYVFYSFDENGQAVIPRVAIRMQNEEIAEVRGVGVKQNLDAQINESSVVSNKLKEFGAKAKIYEKRTRHMKTLTQIEKKQNKGEALTKEEIIFLYEINEKIEGFGYEADPRINEIKAKRDLKSDIIEAFDHKYTRDEITTTKEEFLKGKSKIHFGDLDFSEVPSLILLKKFRYILFRSLNLNTKTSDVGLKLPEVLIGNLNLSGFTSAEGIKLPEVLNGNLGLNSSISIEGLVMPVKLNGTLYRINTSLEHINW